MPVLMSFSSIVKREIRAVALERGAGLVLLSIDVDNELVDDQRNLQADVSQTALFLNGPLTQSGKSANTSLPNNKMAVTSKIDIVDRRL